jgi:Anti-sigma-K factor rskA/Putative zinc-finger
MTPDGHGGCELRKRDEDNAACYVLGALDEAELESYREHLAGCVECATEVAALQPIADSLALGVVRVQAPPVVLDRLMRTVSGEAELLHAAGHEADRPTRARARRWGGWRPALAAATALLAGLAIGALAINTGSSSHTTTKTIEAVVALPAGHHTSAALRKSGSHVELVVTNMPAPPPGRIYEVWVERGAHAPAPTDALFSVTNSGAGSVGVPGDLAGVSKVLVTSEPLGGSLKPTRPPVIVAPL